MAQITLTKSECIRGLTPKVCLVCGEKGATHREVTLVNQSQYAMASKMSGIGDLELGVEGLLPLCNRHAGAFSFRSRALVPLLCFGGLALTFISGAVGVFLFARSGQLAMGMLVCFAPAFVVCAALVLAAIIHFWVNRYSKVSVGQIDQRGIRLENVHDGFVDALEDEREREDQDRRPRKRK